MINHKHKYIFIHIGKTGGTSIEHALDPHVGLDDNPKLKSTKNTDFNDKHYTLARYIDEYPDCYNDYYKFTFVRNPWDREVSRWKWFTFCGYYNDADITFLEHLKLPGNSYYEWLNNSKQGYAVDYIGRFEHLQQDFDTICDQIGIPRHELPHTNKTKHKHYTEYYDDASREHVAERYSQDIEYFGYKFDQQQ